MLTAHQIQDAATRLDHAERTRRQIRMLSLEHPAMTIDDAYAVQAAWIANKLAAGRRIIGHKIGLTSRAMQQALNISTPDSGVLMDDMLFADGSTIPGDRFIQTRVEAELAFILKSDLRGPDCTLVDVMSATDFVAPALEILDTRILRVDSETGAARTVMDTIADNAANAGIVLGGTRAKPTALDLPWVGAIVSLNATVEETGLAAGVLGHPATGIVWLVRRLAERGGGLKAGEVVLSGSFIRPIETRKGDKIIADFGPLGTASCSFG